MATAGPAFALIEVPAWGFRALRWEAPCCVPCAIVIWPSLGSLGRPRTIPKEATLVFTLDSGRRIAWGLMFPFGV